MHSVKMKTLNWQAALYINTQLHTFLGETASAGGCYIKQVYQISQAYLS